MLADATKLCGQRKTSTTLTTAVGANEPEYSDLPESHLPDNVLAFMQQNDLPVFIDNKQHKTISYNNMMNKSVSRTMNPSLLVSP